MIPIASSCSIKEIQGRHQPWLENFTHAPYQLFLTHCCQTQLRQSDLVFYCFLSSIYLFNRLWLKSGTNRKVELVGTLVIEIWVGESCVRIMLGIVENTTASVHQVTSLIDRIIYGTFCAEKMMVRFYSPVMAILGVHEVKPDSSKTNRKHHFCNMWTSVQKNWCEWSVSHFSKRYPELRSYSQPMQTL